MNKYNSLPKNVKLSLLAIISLVVVFFASLLSVESKPTRACGDGGCGDFEKIKICHATPPDSAANGWVEEYPASIGALMGHVRNDDADIVPPFGDFVGKNWNVKGQAIWNNGCKIPELTLTPTPTPEDGPSISMSNPSFTCGTNYVKFEGHYYYPWDGDNYIKFLINGREPEVFYGGGGWWTDQLTLVPGEYQARVELWGYWVRDWKLKDSVDSKFTIDECQGEPTPTSTPSSTSGRGGPVGAPSCGAATPNAPYLVSATAIGGNKVNLNWQKVANATHYTISYGPNSGNYPWGVPNTGDTDNYEVGALSSGCFVVRAVNDCAPSLPSNEVCTGQVQGLVLGLSSTSGGSNYAYIIIGFASVLFGTKLIRKENFV